MSEIGVKMSRRPGLEGGNLIPDPVLRLVQRHSADMRPITSVEEGADRYFSVQGVDPADLESLRSDLSNLDMVEAAYIKPADELP